MYHDKSKKYFRNPLVICLLKSFVSNTSGEKIQSIQTTLWTFILNFPQHHNKVLHFYLEIFQPRYKSNTNKRNKGCALSINIFQLRNYQGKLSDSLTKFYNSLGCGCLDFSLGVDGNKAVQGNQMSEKYRSILAGSIKIVLLVFMDYQKKKRRR